MSASTAVAIFAAGLAAGTINTIVGSGSLITFPTLLAVGYPAVTANVTNTVGLVPGVVSGSVGYRRELSGQRQRLVVLGGPAVARGRTGGGRPLVLPGAVVRTTAPRLLPVARGRS